MEADGAICARPGKVAEQFGHPFMDRKESIAASFSFTLGLDCDIYFNTVNTDGQFGRRRTRIIEIRRCAVQGVLGQQLAARSGAIGTPGALAANTTRWSDRSAEVLVNTMSSRRKIGYKGRTGATRTNPWRSISLLCLLAAAISVGSPAQTFTTLYSFTGGADGGSPQYGGLIADSAGNLYGTTISGGDFTCPIEGNGCGVVFKFDLSTNQETALYAFTGGDDGAQPWSGLILDSKGNLFGTAAFGGEFGQGVIFGMNASGKLTVLHPFRSGNGENPTGDLILDKDGNLYGTTVDGGNPDDCSGLGCGVIFKKPASGKLEVLHRFAYTGSAGGANPTHAVTMDAAGNIYVTTENGGPSLCSSDESQEAVTMVAKGCGEILRLDPTGKNTAHYGLIPLNGVDPRSSLILDSAGNLYGTTFYGGQYGFGTVFMLDPEDQLTVLYPFQGLGDGGHPWGGVVRDAAGNLYGTTYSDYLGTTTGCLCGTVFKLDSQGNYTVLHTFKSDDGAHPKAPLLLYQGALYGTTSEGGSSHMGTIFRITLPSAGPDDNSR